MRRGISGRLILACLTVSLSAGPAQGQTTQQSAVQGSAGGTASAGSTTLVATIGQPGPIGVATTSQTALYGGFIYTLSTGTTGEPPVIQIPSPPGEQASGEDISIGAAISDESAVTLALLDYRMGGELNFSSLEMSLSGGQYRASIPASAVTSRGVEYIILAHDDDGNVARLPAFGVYSIQIRVSGEGVARGAAQPSGTAQTAYRMISMPLDLDDKSASAVLQDDLGSYDNTKWRFFEYKSDGSYPEYPSTASMTAGKGFWLIVGQSGKTIDTGAGVSNPTNGTYRLPLASGWNLVGSPFNFEIPASNLRLTSGGTPELRSYAGSWNDPVNAAVTGLAPFDGYAIFSDGDTLLVNPDLSGALEKEDGGPPPAIELAWGIRIRAQCQEAVDVDNLAGVALDASENRDEHDRPEPPVIGDYVSISFPHPEWEAGAKSFCTDLRPASADGHMWELQIKRNIPDHVELSFEDIDQVPTEFGVWLIDPVLKTSQNLRETISYSVRDRRIDLPRTLRLVVGREGFINQQSDGLALVPAEFELSQNYPNPFNPSTSIRYGLPRETRVTLKVHNLIGEEVATLVEGELRSSGFHVALWDGRDRTGRLAASGMYIYSLTAGDFTMSKRMVFLK